MKKHQITKGIRIIKFSVVLPLTLTYLSERLQIGEDSIKQLAKSSVDLIMVRNIRRLEDLGATRPSFQLLRRAGGPFGPLGPFGPFWGPSAPSSVAEGAKEDILNLVSKQHIGQNRQKRNKGPKMVPKQSQNSPKMVPKWFQNGPKVVLKLSQSGPKRLQKWSEIVPKQTRNAPKMVQKWFQNGPNMVPKQF